jgi:hypothetical protein
MNYIISALAVYKLVQILDALTPREAMPWVKILATTVLSYLVTIVVSVDEPVIGGLVISALAGLMHTLLRLLTLTGDMAQRKSTR